MTKAEVIRNEIIDAAKTISEAALSKLDYLYLGEAVITLADDFSSTYEFLYQGETYTGVSLTGEKYSVDDIVYVLFSNANDIKKMIVSKKQRYSSMEIEEVVLSYNNLKDLPNLKLVATTGNYNDLINKPALKTVATTGAHSDLTGIPTQATRWPTWAEVSGKPTTFAPSSHTHSYLPLSGGSISGVLKVTGTGGVQSDGGYYTGDNLFHKGYIDIPQNGNLNNYTEPGWYSTGSSANSATIANTPNNKASVVEVLPNYSSGNITQRSTTYDTGEMFWRTRYNGTWYPWATVSKNGHTHTWSEVSGGSTAAIPTSGSSGTWTSVNMSGSKGGYAGIYFTDYARYFMVNASIQGFHTGSDWQWYFSNGALAVGTVPWSLVSGKPTTFAPAAHNQDASTINSGTFADARIPNLNASKITAGTIADARLPAKAKPTDFVVEQGSNYTKWNSGKLEQWGNILLVLTTGTVRQANLVFPINFVDTKWVMTNSAYTGGLANVGPVSHWNKTARSTDIGCVRSTTGNVDSSWYAIGRWK